MVRWFLSLFSPRPVTSHQRAFARYMRASNAFELASERAEVKFKAHPGRRVR